MSIVEKAKRLITESTDLLTEQFIDLGTRYGYIAYTSITNAAWRESMVGVSSGLIALLSQENIQDLDPNLRMELNDWDEEIIGYFRDRAIVHQKREIELYMYTGLLKHYRDVYLDLIKSIDATTEETEWLIGVINGYFNRGEAVTCFEYQRLSSDSSKELEAERQKRFAEKHEIIQVLGDILENRSDETGQHVRRVASVSSKLAMLYGLSDEEVYTIYTASPLHDVGKIAVPDAILNKPGRLTKQEFEVVKRHSAVGYELLKGSDSYLMQMASIIAYEHHEKWDGNGYPCGKAGEDIHIFARIVAIADVFDALLSKRPYKNVWAREEVLQEFIDQKGKHFDPDLCQLLIDNFEEIADLHSRTEDLSLEQIRQFHSVPDVA